MAIHRRKSFWLLVAVAYTVISLLLLRGRYARPVPVRVAPRRVELAHVTLDRELTQPEESQDGRLLTFKVPVGIGDLDNVSGIGFSLRSPSRARKLTIQVIAECDHRYSFAHDYLAVSCDEKGFSFFVPFRRAGGYWSAVGHDGVWSAWNVAGLRLLEIKVFSKEPSGTDLHLAYGLTHLDAEDGLTLAWARPLAEPVALGKRFELAFDLTGWKGNPFDPDDLSVWLEVQPPSGEPKRMAAFLYQNFAAVMGETGERTVPKGHKHWRARYRPLEEGIHRYALKASSEDGAPAALADGQFTVTPGQPPDFIQISQRNPRYFAHADGSFFYPVGWSIAYPVDRPYRSDYVPYLPHKDSLCLMRKMLDDLADCGGNIARLWMAEWWTGIEWNEEADCYGGLGRYNLKNAWLIDRILEQCEKRGIYLIFETLNHVRFNFMYSWYKNPYCSRSGGFAKSPSDFWTSQRIIAPSQKRLGYIVARYADSPAIHSFHYVSEMDQTVGMNMWRRMCGYVSKRTSEFLEFVKQKDPYGHIVSNHVCRYERGLWTSFYKLPAVEFIHSNAYCGLGGLSEDQIYAVRGFSEFFSARAKPVVIGEYAGNWQGDRAYKMRRDTLGGLWAGIASEMSATPLSWWWNFNYGEDLGKLYKNVADFMVGEDLIEESSPGRGGWKHRQLAANSAAGNAHGLMVGSRSKRFLFLFNFDTMCRTRALPTVCSEVEVSFAEMDPGVYVAEYWDLRTGKTDVRQRVVVEKGRGILRPPDFEEGWAVKIYPSSDAAPEAGTAARQEPQAPPSIAPSASALEAWQWRIRPLLPIRHPEATARCAYEAFIALPRECRGALPCLRDARGDSVEFAWRFLADGSGWHIRIPATREGPFELGCSTTAQVPATGFDERTIGLQVSVIEGVRDTLSDTRGFENLFRSARPRKTVRVSRIDQLENPTGGNDHFVALYRGPLFVPRDGRYSVAINSDDGSFLKLDGRAVVRWLGNHNPDSAYYPLQNRWRQRISLDLEAGVHWVEFYHQEMIGSQLARVGWLAPEPAAGASAHECFFHAFSADPGGWEVIPDHFFDGRIPCSVEVIHEGTALATIIPCAGLRLRRPARDIFVLRLKLPGAEHHQDLFFDEAGGRELSGISGLRRPIPVWVHNTHMRPFSVEWEQGASEDGSGLLRSLVYDADLPLQLSVSTRTLGTKRHEKGKWTCWDLQPQDMEEPFVLSFAGLSLVSGRIEWWPCEATEAARPIASQRTTELIQPTTIMKPCVLPADACRDWYSGETREGQVVASCLRFDIWTGSVPELTGALGDRSKGRRAVLIILDQMPILKGLSPEDVRVRTHACVRALAESGFLPVLAVGSEFELEGPLQRRYLAAFVQLAEAFDCPCLGLRGLER